MNIAIVGSMDNVAAQITALRDMMKTRQLLGLLQSFELKNMAFRIWRLGPDKLVDFCCAHFESNFEVGEGFVADATFLPGVYVKCPECEKQANAESYYKKDARRKRNS